MTHELASNIAFTGLLFSLLFAAAIKFHGDDKPHFVVMAIETIGVLFSCSMFFVFSLVTVWMR